MKVKHVKNLEALKDMQAVYEARGWRVVQGKNQIEAFDPKSGKLKGVAKI